MKTSLSALFSLAVTTLALAPYALAQDSQPTATCASAGGECMEGCEPGYRDVGNFDCFDSTCCVAGVDQTTPAAVVSTVFDAARSGDFSALGGLCDPGGEADGDVRSICALATDATGGADFVAYFQAGRVNGEATVEGEAASVPILFGPDGSRAETIRLVKRGDLWYLQSF